MTFHILTLQKPGTRLSVDRGFLVCQYPDKTENRMPLAEIRSLIVGVPSVAFTQETLARLLAQDSLVLHCDSHYKPIGWSTSFDRVIRGEVFENQIAQNPSYNHLLWKKIIFQKMKNQSAVLTHLGIEHDLERLIQKPLANEANIAKQFWGHYFKALGKPQKRERQGADSFENKALNYGYAVVSTLVHRSILLYGLLPSLGIHHEFRYRSTPLVYDLMEPFRSFVDLFLALWIQNQLHSFPLDDDFDKDTTDMLFKDWVKYLMNGLIQCRLKVPGEKHSRKLMDAIDFSVRSVASCHEKIYYSEQNFEKLWLPAIEHHYWYSPKPGEALENSLDNEEEEEEDPFKPLSV